MLSAPRRHFVELVSKPTHTKATFVPEPKPAKASEDVEAAKLAEETAAAARRAAEEADPHPKAEVFEPCKVMRPALVLLIAQRLD